MFRFEVMENFWTLDIETSALPAEVLSEIIPEFEANKTLKDPEKIKVDLQKKADEWRDESALHAYRSRVLAIGTKRDDETPIVLHGMEEKEMLLDLRRRATDLKHYLIVGHNILGFDIPFVCRRMWAHGIQPPTHWLDCTPWRCDWAFDTMSKWACGNRDQRISLDHLAFHLGAGRKNGDGKDFAALYATDQDKALEYVRNDLILTEKCFLKMR